MHESLSSMGRIGDDPKAQMGSEYAPFTLPGLSRAYYARCLLPPITLNWHSSSCKTGI
jgi:hypothetical protein